MKKYEYFCPECGGTDILTQNFLDWNKEKQEWKVADDRPDIDWIDWCNDCDEEILCGLGKREIKETSNTSLEGKPHLDE